jgi:hypothetical protein
MRDVLFFVALAVYGLAGTFAFYNRNSEKITTTLLLGVLALISSIFAVAVFSSEPPIRKVFSVPILIHANTKFPVEGFPYPVFPMGFDIQVREKLKAHQELLPDPKEDAFAQGLYHHALQRAIIYWLESKYPASWQVDIYPMTLGEISGYQFQGKAVPSRLYSHAELRRLMSGNLFGDIPGPFGPNGDKFGLAVPPETNIGIVAPHQDKTQGDVSTIKLKNRYSTITIEIRRGFGSAGAGSYRMLFGMTQDQAQSALVSAQFSMVVSTTFNPLLTGNPDMPKYKTWASDITDGLETQFSDQVIWPKTKDWLLFHKVAGM